jgi:hypothetical protein
MLRLTQSALGYFERLDTSAPCPGFLRRANYILLNHTKGFALKTFIHTDVSRELQYSEKSISAASAASGDFTPVLYSSVSFDGSMLNQLHRNFLGARNDELRERIMLIHFMVLKMIIISLPQAFTQGLRLVDRATRPMQLFVYSMSMVYLVGGAWPIFRPHLLMTSLIPAGLGSLMPWLVRRLLGLYLRCKLRGIKNEWYRNASA